jgi:DNA modification methylase
MKQRRSLSHVGGMAEMAGTPDVAAKLADALDVKPAPSPGSAGAADAPDRAHVHGFHTYSARMHPTTAARLVRALTGANAVVLDPFCGSGTVLVEAMIAGRRAIGTDLNPLAVRLARLKTARSDEKWRESLVAVAHAVAAFADSRREGRAGATHRYPREDVETFDPHVLLELDSLRAGIEKHARGDARLRAAVQLVLSAMVVKVSRRAADTSTALKPRRLAAGFTTRLFARKAGELSGRLADLEKLLPPGALDARVDVDDAARLRTVPASTVDAVVTSPPYAGTYDYLAHHALRMRWLDLDTRAFEKGEMGARRRYAPLDARAARDQWTRELGAALRSMARACRPGARIVLVLADSAVRGQALRAPDVLSVSAEDTGLALVARASQPRPHFHGPTAPAFRDTPRWEHAIVLEKR